MKLDMAYKKAAKQMKRFKRLNKWLKKE
jgi:hypothetical protein